MERQVVENTNTAAYRRQQQRRSVLIRRRRVLLGLLVFLCAYFAMAILSTQLKIDEQQQQLNAVLEQIELAREENDELIRIMNGGEQEYIERIAREKLGYAAVDERVFEDISGIG